MANESVKLFLSCVSDEFGAYRDELRRKLTRPNVEVAIQEDFKALGGDTLMMLEQYIERCEAVVHFVGDMTGSAPKDFGVGELLMRRPDLKGQAAAGRRSDRCRKADFLHAVGGVARALFSQGFGDRRAHAGRGARSGIRPNTGL